MYSLLSKLSKVEEDKNEDKSVALRRSLAALNLVHGGIKIIPPFDAGGLDSCSSIPEDHEPSASPLKSACCRDASLSGVLSPGYEVVSLLQLLHVEASKAF